MKGAFVAGAVGAVVVLVVYSLAGFTGRALFPWFEGNQGFLSVLALTIALTFALMENHRANTAARADRAEFISVVLEILDGVETARAGLLGICLDPARAMHGQVDSWNASVHRAKESLEAIHASAPRDAKLLLAVTQAIRILHGSGISNQTETAQVMGKMITFETTLGTLRAPIAALA